MDDTVRYKIGVETDAEAAQRILREMQRTISDLQGQPADVHEGWMSPWDTLDWETSVEDVAEFSMRYPQLLFTLQGQTIDGDLWRCYYLNGQVQQVRGWEAFPPARPSRMGSLAHDTGSRQSLRIEGQDYSPTKPEEMLQVRLRLEGGIIEVEEIAAGVCLVYDDLDEDNPDDDRTVTIFCNQNGVIVRRVDQTSHQAT